MVTTERRFDDDRRLRDLIRTEIASDFGSVTIDQAEGYPQRVGKELRSSPSVQRATRAQRARQQPSTLRTTVIPARPENWNAGLLHPISEPPPRDAAGDLLTQFARSGLVHLCHRLYANAAIRVSTGASFSGELIITS